MASKTRAKKKEATEAPSFKMLTYEESLAHFDAVARRYLGMSGEEFLKAWNEGKYKDVDIDTPELMRVIMLLPMTIPPVEPAKTSYAKTKKRGVAQAAGEFKMLTHEEALDYFDKQVRRCLGMSGEEFLKAWNEGKYKDVDIDTPEMMQVVMLMPMTVPPAQEPTQ